MIDHVNDCRRLTTASVKSAAVSKPQHSDFQALVDLCYKDKTQCRIQYLFDINFCVIHECIVIACLCSCIICHLCHLHVRLLEISI